MSCRGMYYLIQPDSIGRDKFELWCKDLGFKSVQKINRMKTTYSLGVQRFENLVLNYHPIRMNEVYYSDITYYRVGSKFYYLTFIVDGFMSPHMQLQEYRIGFPPSAPSSSLASAVRTPYNMHHGDPDSTNRSVPTRDWQ